MRRVFEVTLVQSDDHAGAFKYDWTLKVGPHAAITYSTDESLSPGAALAKIIAGLTP